MQPPLFIHTIVIGAGQSGLVTSYYLKKRKIDHLVLDESPEVGFSWHKRYDSLTLFTNIRHNSLEGLDFPGPKNRYPNKNETAAYLKQYAKHIKSLIHFNTKVSRLNKAGEYFTLETNKGVYQAQNVIVCTGAFHTPFIPEFHSKISPEILQLHSRDYKNSSQLKNGKILVVGGGNSGVQIVEELVNGGKQVYFSFYDKLKRVPNHPFIVWLLFVSGLIYASKKSLVGNWIMKKGEVIIGTNLKRLFKNTNLVSTGPLLDAKDKELQFQNNAVSDVENIIWATGYRPDFSWIQLPIFDNKGNLITDYGATTIKGLFFVGSAWQRSRASWLIGGVSKDAKYITEKII